MAESSDSSRRQRGGPSQQAWARHKPLIRRWYLHEGQDVQTVAANLQEKGLDVSDNQLKAQFRKWKLRQHIPSDSWKAIGAAVKRRAEQGKESEVLISGVRCPEDKVKSELSRQRNCVTAEEIIRGDQFPLPPDIPIDVCTPAPLLVDFQQNEDMPWSRFSEEFLQYPLNLDGVGPLLAPTSDLAAPCNSLQFYSPESATISKLASCISAIMPETFEGEHLAMAYHLRRGDPEDVQHEALKITLSRLSNKLVGADGEDPAVDAGIIDLFTTLGNGNPDWLARLTKSGLPTAEALREVAFGCAVRTGALDIARAALISGIDPNIIICRNGQTRVARGLVDVLCGLPKLVPPLQVAILRDDKDMVRLLLKHNAPVHRLNPSVYKTNGIPSVVPTPLGARLFIEFDPITEACCLPDEESALSMLQLLREERLSVRFRSPTSWYPSPSAILCLLFTGHRRVFEEATKHADEQMLSHFGVVFLKSDAQVMVFLDRFIIEDTWRVWLLQVLNESTNTDISAFLVVLFTMRTIETNNLGFLSELWSSISRTTRRFAISVAAGVIHRGDGEATLELMDLTPSCRHMKRMLPADFFFRCCLRHNSAEGARILWENNLFDNLLATSNGNPAKGNEIDGFPEFAAYFQRHRRHYSSLLECHLCAEEITASEAKWDSQDTVLLHFQDAILHSRPTGSWHEENARLVLAVQQGNLDEARRALDSLREEPSSDWRFDSKAFHGAITMGDIAMTQLLVDSGFTPLGSRYADISFCSCSPSHFIPLCIAAGLGRLDIIKVLLRPGMRSDQVGELTHATQKAKEHGHFAAAKLIQEFVDDLVGIAAAVQDLDVDVLVGTAAAVQDLDVDVLVGTAAAVQDLGESDHE